MKSNKSTGKSGIPIKYIKLTANVIAPISDINKNI